MIEVKQLTKRYGAHCAVEDLTFTVRPGSVTGFLGPNGAGKSTTLLMLLGLLPPRTGTARLFGGPPPAAVAAGRVGAMPQVGGLLPRASVRDLLRFLHSRYPRPMSVAEALDLADLDDVADRVVERLSGGQAQRVRFAMAVIGRPDLLILDEPTAGLDPAQRGRLRDVLSRAGESATVLISTHQTDDVAALCQRVVVIDHGRILHDGTPEALTDHARGRVWLADHADRGAQLSWRTGSGQHRHIGDPPAGATLAEPALEDAYLLLIGRPSDAELERS